MTSTETIPDVRSQRPKRADARRNYDRLIAAALAAFTEEGGSASLEEIATFMPSLARTFAVPSPIPLLDAVTSATLPFSPRSIPLGGVCAPIYAQLGLERAALGGRRRSSPLALSPRAT